MLTYRLKDLTGSFASARQKKSMTYRAKSVYIVIVHCKLLDSEADAILLAMTLFHDFVCLSLRLLLYINVISEKSSVVMIGRSGVACMWQFQICSKI